MIKNEINKQHKLILIIVLLERDPLDRPMLPLKNEPNLSTLRPILGVFVGDASINGIDNSSNNGPSLAITPFPFSVISFVVSYFPHLCLKNKVFMKFSKRHFVVIHNLERQLC